MANDSRNCIPIRMTIWMGNCVWHYTGANWAGSTFLMLTSCAELTVILECHRLWLWQCGEQIQMVRGGQAISQPQRPPKNCILYHTDMQPPANKGGVVVWNSGFGWDKSNISLLPAKPTPEGAESGDRICLSGGCQDWLMTTTKDASRTCKERSCICQTTHSLRRHAYGCMQGAWDFQYGILLSAYDLLSSLPEFNNLCRFQR